MTFTNWAENQPNMSSPTCVSVDMEGMWYSDDCFNSYPFVCAVPADNDTIATITSSMTTKDSSTASSSTIELDSTSMTTPEPTSSVTTPSLPSICRSYIPIAIDNSQDIGLDLYNAVKDFLIDDFLFQTLPTDLQPAAHIEYNTDQNNDNVLPNSIDELVSFMEMTGFNKYDSYSSLLTLVKFEIS